MALSLPAKKLYILWTCILLCLLPFIILSFFNFIAFDDYRIIVSFEKYGFLKAQELSYTDWDGRFTANFLFGVFEKTGILTHYYFLAFLLYALFSCLSVFFFLDSINTYILNRSFSRGSLVLASLVLYILDMYVMVDIAQSVYWFSGATTYYIATIVFLIVLGCLVRRLANNNKLKAAGKLRLDIVIIFLCVVICGCNEVAIIALACFFVLLMAAYRYYGVTIPRSLFLYLGMILLACMAVLLTSGVWTHRRQVMTSEAGYGSVILIILFRALTIFYYVLKEPLFWACAGISFVLGMRMALIPAALKLSQALNSRRYFLPGIMGLVLLVLCTLAPVLWVTHGPIPYRALNNLTSLVTTGFLVMFFLAGVGNPSLAEITLPVKHLSTVFIVLTCCGLLASNNYKESWRNVIAGYFYHAIQTDRQKIFANAQKHHQHVATITPYKVALNEKLRQIFPQWTPVTLQRLLEAPPNMLLFDNTAEDHGPLGAFKLKYYQLDSIVVQP